MKTYQCLTKCHFGGVLRRAGHYYEFPDEMQVPRHFVQVELPAPKVVEIPQVKVERDREPKEELVPKKRKTGLMAGKEE